MKTIEPIKVWYNGSEQDANVLSASASNDNLINSALFYYQLYKSVNYDPAMGNGLIPLTSGVLNMEGQDYINWETNDYAYNWIASKLNLVITGDYIPPVPPEPIPQPVQDIEEKKLP